MLDTNIVSSYVEHIRKAGALRIFGESNSAPLKLSTPLLSWAYYNSTEVVKFNQLIELDKERSLSPLGSNIFSSNKLLFFKEEEHIYFQAIKIINNVWPEFGNIINAIKPIISKTSKNDSFESSSDPKIFGQIIYKMDSDCPVKWAEVICHEIGHHYLNVILTTHSNMEIFSRSWDTKKHSAIRNEERPLIGIYHGAFAQACMIQLAIKISKKTKEDNYICRAKEMLNFYKSKFNNDFETIQKADLLGFDEHISSFLVSTREELDGAG